MIRILICGSRKARNYLEFLEDIEHWLGIKNIKRSEIIIIHGDADGIDRFASIWAQLNNVPEIAFPADWDKFKRAAGHIRNKQMLDEGKPRLVLAFPGGPGTANMIAQATKEGIRIEYKS